MRDKTKTVAKWRFNYHINMLDICNVANQIGLLNNEKAEIIMKHHCMQTFDCLERLGFDISALFDEN